MPEYNCVNIGCEGYPVWLTVSDKSVIAAIEPTAYNETGQSNAAVYALLTTVTLVVAGCCVEVKSPLPVSSVCRILGFMWDERDVVDKPAPAEPESARTEPPKPEGGAPQ